jgi:pimeloyl-ACP methyl ester carboxylesterase
MPEGLEAVRKRRGVRVDLRTATTRLGPVEYDLHGSEGPVVLSVHAGLGGADQERLFASWLQPDGFRILSPSRPGYLGTPLESGRTNEEQADLLAALLDELGIDRVGVLAVSAGSPVGYTFAARHPDRVGGLVSIGGVSKPQPAEPRSPLRRTFLNTVGQRLTRLTAQLSFKTILAGTLAETSTFTDEQRAARISYITNTPHVQALFEAMFDTTFPSLPGALAGHRQRRGSCCTFHLTGHGPGNSWSRWSASERFPCPPDLTSSQPCSARTAGRPRGRLLKPPTDSPTYARPCPPWPAPNSQHPRRRKSSHQRATKSGSPRASTAPRWIQAKRPPAESFPGCPRPKGWLACTHALASHCSASQPHLSQLAVGGPPHRSLTASNH